MPASAIALAVQFTARGRRQRPVILDQVRDTKSYK